MTTPYDKYLRVRTYLIEAGSGLPIDLVRLIMAYDAIRGMHMVAEIVPHQGDKCVFAAYPDDGTLMCTLVRTKAGKHMQFTFLRNGQNPYIAVINADLHSCAIAANGKKLTNLLCDAFGCPRADIAKCCKVLSQEIESELGKKFDYLAQQWCGVAKRIH